MPNSILSTTSSKPSSFTGMISEALEKKHDVSDLFISIVSYPINKKNEILNELDVNFLMMVMKEQPSSLPSFLTLLHDSPEKDTILQTVLNSRLTEVVDYLGLEPNALQSFFYAVTNKFPQSEFGFYGDTIKAFFNTMHQHFNALPYLLEVVKKLPLEAKRVIYTKDHLSKPGSLTGDNALSVFIRHYKNASSELKTLCFENLLADIAKLEEADQIQIFTTVLTKYEGEDDLLRLSALHYPEAIPTLLDRFDQLPKLNIHNRFFSDDNTIHKTLLNLWQNDNPEAIPAIEKLLTKISQLQTDNRINILSLDNLRTILCRALIKRLQVKNVMGLVEKLDPEEKKQLLSVDINILKVAAAHYPDALPSIFNMIQEFDTLTQQQIIIHSCKNSSVLNLMDRLSIIPFLTIVKDLDKTQRSIIFPKNSVDINKKVFAYPEAISTFIQVNLDNEYLTPILLHEALDFSFDAFMGTIQAIIERLPQETAELWLANYPKGSDNLLIRMLKKYPMEVDKFLEVVSKFSLKSVRVLLIDKDSRKKNSLDYAIKFEPNCVKVLINASKVNNVPLWSSCVNLIEAFKNPVNKVNESINQLDNEDLELLFTQKAVMETLVMAPKTNIFQKFINIINGLPESHKIKIFTETNKWGHNILMRAIDMDRARKFRDNNFYAQDFLKIIATFPDKIIISIFQSREYSDEKLNCFEMSRICLGQDVTKEIFSLELFPDRLQVQYFIATWVNKKAFEINLSKSLQSLDSDSRSYKSPEIATLKMRLDKMKIGGTGKRVRVLDSYNKLKKDSSNFPGNLIDALAQNGSPISLALKMERFPFSIREATSLRELRGQALMSDKKSIKSNDKYSANFSYSDLVVPTARSLSESIFQFRTLIFKSSTLKPAEIKQLKQLSNDLVLNKFNFESSFKEMVQIPKPNRNSIGYVFKLCVKDFYEKTFQDNNSQFESEYLFNLAECAPIKLKELQKIAEDELERFITLQAGSVVDNTKELQTLVNKLKTDKLLFKGTGHDKAFVNLTRIIETSSNMLNTERFEL